MTLALNQLHLGNCISLMRQLPSSSIDLILTDPPYLVDYKSRDGRTIVGDNTAEWVEPAFQETYRVLKPHHFMICFYGWNHIDRFMTAWRKAGFRVVGHFVFAKHYASRTGLLEARHECAYLLAKGNPRQPRHILPDVLPWGKYTGNKLHPTQKPVELMRQLARSYSDIGDIILDPFAGSGSTLIAAHQLKRSWIGCEIDPTYHRKAYQRLEAFD